MTSSRLLYQDLRGLTRNFSIDLPVIRSQVHLTSAAVNGLPSCHFTPSRSLKVSSLPSSLHDQLEARSETIELRVFCGTCWSNITIIEHAHHRSEHHNRRLLVDRHAGDASTERNSEDTARLLRQGRVARP